MSVPSVRECVRLMDQYRMLDNIRHHSLVVARVADLLVLELQKSLPDKALPDRKLCVSGALLHDIAKTLCLDGSCDHALEGAAICREQGYGELSEIVEQHVIIKEFTPDRYQKGLYSAREIVYYADKRVRHSEIVSLEARLTYILKYYGKNNARLHRLIRENFEQCVQLEGFLFTFLDFRPDQLAQQVLGQDALLSVKNRKIE